MDATQFFMQLHPMRVKIEEGAHVEETFIIITQLTYHNEFSVTANGDFCLPLASIFASVFG